MTLRQRGFLMSQLTQGLAEISPRVYRRCRLRVTLTLTQGVPISYHKGHLKRLALCLALVLTASSASIGVAHAAPRSAIETVNSLVPLSRSDQPSARGRNIEMAAGDSIRGRRNSERPAIASQTARGDLVVEIATPNRTRGNVRYVARDLTQGLQLLAVLTPGSGVTELWYNFPGKELAVHEGGILVVDPA